jgi:dTDP-4-amino-4,6-dideoxygalactose transaminase
VREVNNLSTDDSLIPFNDMARIHKPLVPQFKERLGNLVESSHLVLGAEVELFEKELAEIEGSNFAVGVNSGTSAIELTLRALDIGLGDEVITTSFTFVATCFAILQTGATPVLIDINPRTGLLDPNCVADAITKRTRALVLVTLHGRVEGLDELQEICKQNGLAFIIDAAQSHLGTFKDLPQSKFCDAATLSFYPGKNLGALGEAGAVITDSTEIAEKIKVMRDWGATEKYNHDSWGGNFRLETIQAGFLRIKLPHLRKWTENRKEIAKTYQGSINPEILMDPIQSDGSHVYHIYSINCLNRDNFTKSLANVNIGFGFHYPKAVHEQSAYKNKVIVSGELPNAEALARTTLSIPLFPEQRDSEIERVIGVLNKLVSEK